MSAADSEAVARRGAADVMVTHEAPWAGTLEVDHGRRASEGELSASVLQYVAQSVDQVNAAVDAVQPGILVHGHWHLKGEVELENGRRVYSLAAEHQPGSIGLLNLGTLEWRWLYDPKRR